MLLYSGLIKNILCNRLGTGVQSSVSLINSHPLDSEKFQPLLSKDEDAGTDPISTPKLWEQEHDALFV
jgi:hypothetical protein